MVYSVRQFAFIGLVALGGCDVSQDASIESTLGLNSIKISAILADRISSTNMMFSYTIENPYEFPICIAKWNEIIVYNVKENRPTHIDIRKGTDERLGVIEIAPNSTFERIYKINPATISFAGFSYYSHALSDVSAYDSEGQPSFVDFDARFNLDLQAELRGEAVEYVLLCDGITYSVGDLPAEFSPPNSPYISYSENVPLYIAKTQTQGSFRFNR